MVTWHYDNREPEKRRRVMEYWTELLLSASPALMENGRVSAETVEGMKLELKNVAKDPFAVFVYSFVQARASVP